MPRVYLDVCCLNRPFDDQSQDRVRLEAAAVLAVLGHVQYGDWEWISGEAVDFEVEQMPDPARRSRIQRLLHYAQHEVIVTQPVADRQRELEGLGFRPLDALHVACAESAAVDVFLSTDDRLVRLAGRLGAQLQVRVENPLPWLGGMTTP